MYVLVVPFCPGTTGFDQFLLLLFLFFLCFRVFFSVFFFSSTSAEKRVLLVCSQVQKEVYRYGSLCIASIWLVFFNTIVFPYLPYFVLFFSLCKFSNPILNSYRGGERGGEKRGGGLEAEHNSGGKAAEP